MLGQFKAIFEQVAQWCDVIILYSVPTNGLQTVLSARFLDKPVLFHSLDVLHRMTGYSFLRAPTWALERFVYSRVDKVVVISAALRRYMEGIGVRPEDIILLPPAVNTRRFAPTVSGEEFRRELGITRTEKLVLFSGWLYEFSGLDFLLSSLNEVTAQRPEIRIVICGDGPLRDKLQQMQERLSLGRYVKIIGRRPYSEMPSIVAAADICINPYLPDIRGNFAFPSKIAEYMAAGKPVLATDLPGTKSILGEDSGVVLVPPEQFMTTLKALLDEEELRIQAGRKCREFCVQNFSLEGVATTLETVLRELVSQNV